MVTAYDYPGWLRADALAEGEGDLPVDAAGSPVDVARSYLGVAVPLGRDDASAGIDCSGLVHMAYRRLGRLVPRDADQQEDAAVEVDKLEPGDLITYGEPVDHIAFWLGDGRILHSTGREDGIGVVEELEPASLHAQRRKLVPPVITWATSDGREEGGDRVVPAASTIKLFVASAFWRSGLDPVERAEIDATPWSVADRLAGPLTLGDCALLMLAFSDNAATNALLRLLGFDAVNREAERLGAAHTEVRRLMMGEGPENVTCARDLARGLAAIDEPRILDALSVAHDSELPHRLSEHEVLVKTGEIWPRVYHEVALVDRRLAVAVCSAPASLPGDIAATAERVIRASLD